MSRLQNSPLVFIPAISELEHNLNRSSRNITKSSSAFFPSGCRILLVEFFRSGCLGFNITRYRTHCVKLQVACTTSEWTVVFLVILWYTLLATLHLTIPCQCHTTLINRLPEEYAMLRPEQWMPQAEALNALSMQYSFDSYPTRLGDTWMIWRPCTELHFLFSQGLSLGNLFTSPSWSSAKRPPARSTMNLCTVLSQHVIFTSTERWLNSHETVWLWALPCTAGISKTFQACLARRIWADSCILRCQIEEGKLNLKTIMQTYTQLYKYKHITSSRSKSCKIQHFASKFSWGSGLRTWHTSWWRFAVSRFSRKTHLLVKICVIARQNAYSRVLMNTAGAVTTYCLHLLSHAEIL